MLHRQTMKSHSNYSLKTANSFAVESKTPHIYFPSSNDDLVALSQLLKDQTYYLLGDGSNTLFFEELAPVIVAPRFYGVEIQETELGFIVEVGGSENWHNLVISLIDQNINGLENLALIPGTVGAAPVQNIGAYGKDISMYCTGVTWFSMTNQRATQFSNEQCQFSYRDSLFKHDDYNKGIITKVSFFFPKKWQAQIEYGELQTLPPNVTAKEVMEKVIEVRNLKLPNPETLPNAGSFFKNPVVSNQTVSDLQRTFPDIPVYPVDESNSKLAAGWLIDQAGLKGFTQRSAAVHDRQALVIVNKGNATGNEIIHLAKFIQSEVHKKFAVYIEPEVRLVSSRGEQPFSAIDVASLC